MLAVFGKVFRERIDELKWAVIVSCVTWLLGSLIMAGTWNLAADDKPDVELATLIMGMVMLFYMLFIGIFSFATEFYLAVGMGVTRKKFVPAYLFCTFLMEAVLLLLLYGGYFLERQISHLFYTGWGGQGKIGSFLFSPYLFALVILLSVAQIFIGSILLKYGRKAMWIFWVFWMMLCLVPGRISDAMESHSNSLAARFGFWVQKIILALDGTGIIFVILAASAAFLAATCLIVRRQQITSR